MKKYLSHALPTLTAICLGIPSLPAVADAGDWIVRGRIVNVSPDEQSSTIRVGGASVAGSGVSVDNDTIPELDITYMLSNNLGLELILGTSQHDVHGKGTLAGLGHVIDADVLPPTLTLQYHFQPESSFRPYAGLGVNYTLFYDEKVKGGLDAPNAKVSMDASWGLAAQLGVDIDVGEDWFLNFDVKYIQMDTTAKFRNSTVGSAAVDVDIDPWVFGIGFGKTF
ncbi:MAG: OmpW family protein [Pseudohongiellaceae bacterium]|nr:OmpW family protein [Pseudohongiellaceae bacterium]